MIRGGSSEKTQNKSDFTFKCSRPDCESVVSAPPQRDFIEAQYLKYTAHTEYLKYTAHPNDTLTKRVPFARPQRRYCRDPWCRISEILNVSKFQAQKATLATHSHEKKSQLQSGAGLHSVMQMHIMEDNYSG